MAINASLQKKLKFYTVDISFSCPDGKVLAMIGPSGGGKTTIVRMLAGLMRPDAGEIVYNENAWFDSKRRIDVPTQKRCVGYVFQDYTLFPHLNLYENAAFAAVDRKEVDDLFERFGITHLAKRKPDQVSGGERQRCAICQAIARRPRVLLLDEPFSALDVCSKRGLRKELNNLKTGFSFPVIYVTHDLNEALYLGDSVLPVVDGRPDDAWLKQTVMQAPPTGESRKAAREQRLALAY